MWGCRERLYPTSKWGLVTKWEGDFVEVKVEGSRCGQGE